MQVVTTAVTFTINTGINPNHVEDETLDRIFQESGAIDEDVYPPNSPQWHLYFEANDLDAIPEKLKELEELTANVHVA